jgi:transcriptional regulator with XRE-family HTH domain
MRQGHGASIHKGGKTVAVIHLDAGLTGRQLAVRTGLSQSTVSLIELGQAMPSMSGLQAWGEATRASEGQMVMVRELAEAAAVEAISWRRAARRACPACSAMSLTWRPRRRRC